MHTLIANGDKINNQSVVIIQQDIKEQIIQAFTAMQTERHVFIPEIKVKRRNDTLYISELRNL